jgi:thiamine biosynthesis lipoprotein
MGSRSGKWRRVQWPAVGLGLLAACATPSEHPALQAGLADERRFEFTEPHMGVPFRIVLYAPDQTRAEAAARAAFARIKQLDDLLSDYDTDSELSRLSQTAGQGRTVPVSADLWRVLAQAQALAARTEGAFDVTVGPVVSLWRKARREKKLPGPERLAVARAAVGYQKLRLDPRRRTAELLAPDMRLDLGGIAKGYSVDAALKMLLEQGIRRALVAGAGDLAVSGPPPGQRGWRIELAPLDVSNAPPARFVLLAHAALATSGDVFQHVEIEGRRYSHIVDPRTGLGLTDHSLVTVIAPDCATADSLATAVSVLGPEKGLRLIESTPGAAARMVRQPERAMEVYESSRFKRFYEPPGHG